MSKVVKKTLEGGAMHTEVYRDDDGSLWYESYRLNDERHREDGPAYISYRRDGSLRCKHYELEGELHREDGPAWIKYYDDGRIYEEYWLNGEEYTKEKYKLYLLNKEADECIQELLEGGDK